MKSSAHLKKSQPLHTLYTLAGGERMIVGIDTGGTFTDVVLVRDDGWERFKVPSTPDDPSSAFREALGVISSRFPSESIGGLIYGSTIATNALLENKLARVCFITNKGFEDIFRLGRQNRSSDDLYAPVPADRKVPVPRGMVLGLDVRQSADGDITRDLTTGENAELIVLLDEMAPEGVAIGFLHSYKNPVLEKKLAELLGFSGFDVCVSSDIDPDPYEYERFTTTAVNAGLRPLLNSHLGQLEDIAGFEPMLMQSNGGLAPPGKAAKKPVNLLLSGPAGGVMGLDILAKWTAERKLIGFDMGGDIDRCRHL